MIDAKAFGAELAGIVKAATAPLLDRIDALEKRLGEMPEPPELPDIPGIVANAVAEAMKAVPLPQNGKDGTSVTVEDVMLQLRDQVADFLAAIPAPKDGRDGADGRDGEPGAPGRDGLDVKDLFRADGGRLVAVMSDGTTKDLGQFIGTDGKDGAPGRDGLGFEDLEFTEDEHGRPVAKFQRGNVVKSIALPCIIDRGPYRSGETYRKGDAVSYGGSLWIAQGETGERPDGGAGWRLAVKKGRDGRDTEAKGVL